MDETEKDTTQAEGLGSLDDSRAEAEAFRDSVVYGKPVGRDDAIPEDPDPDDGEE